eukprot:326505-Karenia_brevis.AAC.1
MLAALNHFHHNLLPLSKAGPMSRLLRALQGWTKTSPGGSRDALSEKLVYGVAMEMMRQDHQESAVKTLLAFHGYFRPGEVQQLRDYNLVAPAPKMGPNSHHWSILLHVDSPSKVGVYNDSVILDLT